MTRTKGLIDSGSEVNLISQKFIKELNLPTPSVISSQRVVTVDGRRMQTYGVHQLNVEVSDRLGRVRFFEDTFLACDSDSPVILGMPWLTLANPNVHWEIDERKPGHLEWKKYDARTALETSRRIELSDAEDWAEEAIDEANQVYVMHVKHIPESVTMPSAPQSEENKSVEPTIPKAYNEFIDVFSEESANVLPKHGKQDHAIDLMDDKQPPYGPIYNLSETELTTLRQYIDKNLASQFIRPSKSPAGAPILFVKKSSGALRLCVDYRGLNNITIKNRYPLPLIGESLDRLGKAKRFTQLDLTMAYHRVRIKEGDEWKTAFRTRYGHFEYQVLPFGLSNAPATFQAYINQILAEKLDVCCIVYLDDILIYSENIDQHTEDVKWVLRKLREYGLFVNLSKCKFDADEVRFLGYIVSPKGVRMEEDRIEAIRSWPEPRSIRDIQVFIGFANFYRRFIEGFSRKTAALTSMIKQPSTKRAAKTLDHTGLDNDFLTSEARESFRHIKQCFLEAPILSHFDYHRPSRVETDASGGAIGGILAQTDPEGHWHPCAYYSRKLQPAERNYETHDSELLAIVEAFRQWRHYLWDSQHEILVLTDHNNLRAFMGVKKLSGRQIRWAQELSTYNFRIDYRAGKRNPADGLSRRSDLLEADEDAIESDRRCLHGLQQSLQKGLGLEQPLTPSAEQQISDYEGRCTHTRRCRLTPPISHSAERDWRFDTRLAPEACGDSEIVNRCILVAGTSVTPRVAYPRPGVGVTRVSAQASGLENPSTPDKPETSLSEEIAIYLAGDSVARAVRKGLATSVGSGPSFRPWSEWDNGLLSHNDRIYVPEALRTKIIEQHHDDPMAGHFGVQKTLELLARRYYWPLASETKRILQEVGDPEGDESIKDLSQYPKGMRPMVEDYCQRCAICKRSKAPRHKPYGTLSSLPIPEYKWSDLTLDFIEGLPPSRDWNGAVYNAILVVVDRLTKMTHYAPVTKDLDAEELHQVLDREVFRLHGLPNSIVTDRDSLITSKFWKVLMRYLQIDRRLSTAFHPQTDGQTERQNSTMEQYLRAYINFEQDDWVRWLPKAEFAYNNAYNSSTKMSPFFAMLGYHPRMSYEHEVDKRSINPSADEVAKMHREIMNYLKEQLTEAQERQAKAFNNHAKERNYNIGEWVYLNRGNIKTTRPCKKLDWKLIGPFQIVERYGKNAYRLNLPTNFRFHDVFHVSLLETDFSKGEVDATTIDIDASVEGKSDDYVVEDIIDSRIFDKGELRENSPGGLHYLVDWLNYPESERTWEPVAGVRHLKRLISRFHHRHPDKVTFKSVKPVDKGHKRMGSGIKRSSRKKIPLYR